MPLDVYKANDVASRTARAAMQYIPVVDKYPLAGAR